MQRIQLTLVALSTVILAPSLVARSKPRHDRKPAIDRRAQHMLESDLGARGSAFHGRRPSMR